MRNLRPRPPAVVPALPRRPIERSAQPVTSAISTQARAVEAQGPALTAHPINRPVLPRKRVEKPIPPTGTSSIGMERVDDPSKITPPLQLASRTRRPPGDRPERQVLPQEVIPSQATGMKAPIPTDPPIRPKLVRPPTDRPVRQISSTGIVPAQAGGVIAPVQNIPLAPVQARLPTPAASRAAPRFRSTPESRRAERAKLLQHRFVLEQEAEKRWRMAIDILVCKMLIFEAEHTYVPLPSWWLNTESKVSPL